MKWPKDGQYRESKSQMTTNIRKIYLTITSQEMHIKEMRFLFYIYHTNKTVVTFI